MPYDEAKWKRAALAHYLAIARIDVPLAVQEALVAAAAAEAASAGGLRGLVAKLREELGLPPEKGAGNADPERRPGPERRTRVPR